MKKLLVLALPLMMVFIVGSAVAEKTPDQLKVMTVSQFMDECRTTSAACTKDASAILDNILMAEITDSMTKKGNSVDICPPEDVTDAQKRSALTKYFTDHPEIATASLQESAHAAFVRTWSRECQAADRAHQQLIDRLRRTSVAVYLNTCQTDLKTCNSESSDVFNELMARAMRGGTNGQDFEFCPPFIREAMRDPSAQTSDDGVAQAVHTALVRYFTEHQALSSNSLLDGAHSAFLELWPEPGKCK